ncbi:S8 family peptidase [Longimicrobium sp.]|jgi:subtilisin family serine protease|uniref:S8 family peptidase n=1 Tax=Longimicrobium sp. TaxID=2029185 RepID=UPI002F942A6C
MQRTYLTAPGDLVTLDVDRTRLAVRFHEPAPQTMRLELIDHAPRMSTDWRYEIPGEKYTIFPVAPSGPGRPKAAAAAARDLRKTGSVARVAPVFRAGDGRITALDRVVVQFRRSARGPVKHLEALGYEVVDQHATEYLVRLRPADDPLAVASELAMHPDVVYAEPDFVEFRPVLEPGPAEPAASLVAGRDPQAGSQWARPHTRLDAALKLLRGGAGSPEVRIAILDSGVDYQHPDLQSAIAANCDATLQPPAENPQSGDYHGTACAGLAAAIPFNDQGIRGFGGGCSVLNVRIFHSAGNPRQWVMSSYAMARGIDWAVRNGADVLSLSWETTHPRKCVARAIEQALAEGRGGKGCVVVAGTGNDTPESPRGVKFPAVLPGVVAVGASDKSGLRVTHERNGTSWSSATGPQTALAAPGLSHVTTDIREKKGRNTLPSPGGDYLDDFDGTSSATAIVAGAAGLVLSANPSLTASQVCDLLCTTTGSEPPGPRAHSEETGFGVINIASAVEEALKLSPA